MFLPLMHCDSFEFHQTGMVTVPGEAIQALGFEIRHDMESKGDALPRGSFSFEYLIILLKTMMRRVRSNVYFRLLTGPSWIFYHTKVISLCAINRNNDLSTTRKRCGMTQP